MAYTPQEDQFTYTPYTRENVDTGATYNESLYGGVDDRDKGIGELGVGSLWKRSVAQDILTYYPYDFGFDQMVQVFSDTDTVAHAKPYEWQVRDVFFDYSAAGVELDATDVINNPDAGAENTYTPAAEARYIVSADDGKLFRQYDVVRYETADGYQQAWLIDKEGAGSDIALTLQSQDGTNLPPAEADDSIVQYLGTNYPQELDYEPQPRQSNPDTFFTYVENPRQEVLITREMMNMVKNDATLVDLVMHYREQNSINFRRNREVLGLNGSGQKAKVELANGDVAFFSNGLYNQVKETNLHTSDLKTSGAFDADKFKDAIHKFVRYNFAGETGGPQERMGFVDGTMAEYFDRAWDDIQRFEGNEFIAGVKVRKFGNTNGNINLVTVPSWSEVHPLKGASIRNGSDPKGIMMLLPMGTEDVCRVYEEGFSPQEDVFQINGGSRLWYYRLESKEGLALKRPQYCSVLEEVPE